MATKPTISVSEAFGLPASWNTDQSTTTDIPGSLTAEEAASGNSEPEPDQPEPAEEAEPTPTPEPTKPAPKDAPAKDDQSAEQAVTPPRNKKDGKFVSPSKAAVAAKKDGKAVVPGAPTPAAPAVKGAPPAPGTPPTPPPPAAAPVPAPATKIKVGAKEYTPDELEALVARVNAPPPPPPPVIKPPPTPEEKARTEADLRKQEQSWITDTAAKLEAPIDEATLDRIMAGGKEGLQAFSQLRQQDMARAILFSRKSVYDELGPVLDQIRETQRPLLEEYERVANERADSAFKTDYPHLADKMDLVNTVANTLSKTDPDGVQKLGMKGFTARVAQETDAFLKKYAAPGIETVPPVPGSPPPAIVPVIAATAKPGIPPRAVVKPPGANSPNPSPGAGTKGKSSDKAIIASLL